MNRRSFLRKVAAIPFIGVLVPLNQPRESDVFDSDLLQKAKEVAMQPVKQVNGFYTAILPPEGWIRYRQSAMADLCKVGKKTYPVGTSFEEP